MYKIFMKVEDYQLSKNKEIKRFTPFAHTSLFYSLEPSKRILH